MDIGDEDVADHLGGETMELAGSANMTALFSVLVALLLVWGCSSDSPSTADVGSDTDTDTDSDTDGDSDSDIDWEGDCEALPPLPTTYELRTDIAASEDFTFDDEGNMVHVSFYEGGFLRTSYDGEFELILPSASTWPRGTRMLLDGDVVLADPDLATLMRLTFDGGKSMLATDLNNVNGVAVRDDGMIFATTGPTGSPDDAPNAEVWMVDPDTGDKQIVCELPDASFDGIVFGLNYEMLYVNNEYDGKIYRTWTPWSSTSAGISMWSCRCSGSPVSPPQVKSTRLIWVLPTHPSRPPTSAPASEVGRPTTCTSRATAACTSWISASRAGPSPFWSSDGRPARCTSIWFSSAPRRI
jgi:hypothetical protein